MRGFMMVGGARKQTSRQGLVAFAVRTLITAVAVWVASKIVGGIFLDGWQSTLIVALILGLLNSFLKPLLVMGTLPMMLLSLGLFLIVINTVLLALTAWIAGKFDSIHFAIDGFWAAFWGAVIISVVSFLLGRVINEKRVSRAFAG